MTREASSSASSLLDAEQKHKGLSRFLRHFGAKVWNPWSCVDRVSLLPMSTLVQMVFRPSKRSVAGQSFAYGVHAVHGTCCVVFWDTLWQIICRPIPSIVVMIWICCDSDVCDEVYYLSFFAVWTQPVVATIAFHKHKSFIRLFVSIITIIWICDRQNRASDDIWSAFRVSGRIPW